MAEQKPDGTRGYLVINVLEANGKNKDENFTWDSSNFEGFVKGEGPQLAASSPACSPSAYADLRCSICSRAAGWIPERQGDHQQASRAGWFDPLERAAGNVSVWRGNLGARGVM